MRRAYLKRFSADMINGGRKSPRRASGVDKEGMSFLGYKQRAKGLGGVVVDQDEMARLMGSDHPASLAGLSEARKEALAQSDLPDTIWFPEGGLKMQAFHAQELIAGITMYFSGDHYFFMKRRHGIVSRSILYHGRKRAWRAFERGKIAWAETTAPPSTPPSPIT